MAAHGMICRRLLQINTRKPKDVATCTLIGAWHRQMPHQQQDQVRISNHNFSLPQKNSANPLQVEHGQNHAQPSSHIGTPVQMQMHNLPGAHQQLAQAESPHHAQKQFIPCANSIRSDSTQPNASALIAPAILSAGRQTITGYKLGRIASNIATGFSARDLSCQTTRTMWRPSILNAGRVAGSARQNLPVKKCCMLSKLSRTPVPSTIRLIPFRVVIALTAIAQTYG